MKRVICMLLMMSLIALSAYADRGSIPFNPVVKIYEPAQRAILAWNGVEEILILSTDLRASEPTEILEVIPLPSEPVITESDTYLFDRMIRCINEELYRKYRIGDNIFGDRGDHNGKSPAGEVTFHEKIGAHDITTTHVVETENFMEWVDDYLKTSGVENPQIPEPLEDVIEEYLEEGFTWFVFDIVSLGQDTKTNDAIQYRFTTNSLYYPLKITRTEEGETSIELFVLTQSLLSNFDGIPMDNVSLRHDPVIVPSYFIRYFGDDFVDLFGDTGSVRLRIWDIKGRLSSFKKDLAVSQHH